MSLSHHFGARQTPHTTVVCTLSMRRTSQHPALPVLDYLARCEAAASKANLREWERHYRDGWRLVFDCVFGEMRLPFLHVEPLPYAQPEKPRALKPWEVQKYSRPMRRVIRRFKVDRTGETKGSTYATTMLELECGHVIEEFLFWENDKPPKRRRCSQCSSQVHAAHLVEARRRAAGSAQ